MSTKLGKSCPARSLKLVVAKCSRMCSIVLYYKVTLIINHLSQNSM